MVDLITVMNILLQWHITKQFIGPVDTDWMGEVSFANLGFLMVSLLCCLHVLYSNLQPTKMREKRPWVPLRLLFPRQSKCLFNYIGTGGGATEVNAKCLLKLNIINDKVGSVVNFAQPSLPPIVGVTAVIVKICKDIPGLLVPAGSPHSHHLPLLYIQPGDAVQQGGQEALL